MFSKIRIRKNMSDMMKLDFGSENFQSVDLSRNGNGNGFSQVKVVNDHQHNPSSPSFFKPQPPNLDMVTSKDSGLGLDLLMNNKQRKSNSPIGGSGSMNGSMNGSSRGMSPPSMNLGSSPVPTNSMNNSSPFTSANDMISQPKIEFADLSSDPSPKVDFAPGKLDFDNELDLEINDDPMKPNFNILGEQSAQSSNPFGTSFDSQPSATTFSSGMPSEQPVKKTFEQIQQEKSKMIRKLERFRKKGYFVYRNFDMNSEYDDIKTEYENVREEASLQRSLRQQKDILITTSRVIEGAAGTELVQEYTGKLELEGWSQHMMETVDDYEDIMEDLHDRYGRMFDNGDYPEARLLFAVIHSAIMFHITKKYVQQMPNLGNLLNQNPHLAREFSRATANYVGEQNPAFAGMVNDMNNNNGNNNNGPPENMEPRDMQGPSNLDDILHRLNNNNNMGPNPNMGGGINMDL
jgi:hypothetical protein